MKAARHCSREPPQLLMRLRIVGHIVLDMPPKAFAVAHFADVTQLMDDHRVDRPRRSEHQAPRIAYPIISALIVRAAAPLFFCAGERNRRAVHAHIRSNNARSLGQVLPARRSIYTRERALDLYRLKPRRQDECTAVKAARTAGDRQQHGLRQI